MENIQLLTDLFQAYFDARKNKRNTLNALAFEIDFESKIFELYEEIINRRYIISPSICFIVDKPVKREVFATDFRDRIVHHLIFNYINPMFDKSFINDSYSCRVGKGTHYGIKRVNHFIRSCSDNYSFGCYILKLDIEGYFMAIDRKLVFEKIKSFLEKNLERKEQEHKILNPVVFDLDLILYLIEKVIFNDPTVNCKVKGKRSNWDGLPKTKSLFYAENGKGFPIGNLTSQLFANIYLNEFDRFVKNTFKIKHYGRYVDDFIIVHEDKEYLKSLIPVVRDYLKEKLPLNLHPRKIFLQHYNKGVKFLGAVIKPHRIYIAKRTKGNFYERIGYWNKYIRERNGKIDKDELKLFISSINSYLGIMKHYNTYRLRKKMLKEYLSGYFLNYINIKGGYCRLVNKRRRRKFARLYL